DMTTRLQMELGGKNPLIVLADADLDAAVDLAVKGGYSLSGQACTGTSRVLIEKSVYQAFADKLVERVSKLKVANGMNGGDLGPMPTESQMTTVLEYVAIGKSVAQHLSGGERLTDGEFAHGYYITPAVFGKVTQS